MQIVNLINIDQYCSNSRHLMSGAGSTQEYGCGYFFKNLKLWGIWQGRIRIRPVLKQISCMFSAFKFPDFQQFFSLTLTEGDIMQPFIPVSPSPSTTELDPSFPYMDFIPTWHLLLIYTRCKVQVESKTKSYRVPLFLFRNPRAFWRNMVELITTKFLLIQQIIC